MHETAVAHAVQAVSYTHLDVYKRQEVIINPTLEEFEASDLDLFLAGTATKINMIEAGANEVSDVYKRQELHEVL